MTSAESAEQRLSKIISDMNSFISENESSHLHKYECRDIFICAKIAAIEWQIEELAKRILSGAANGIDLKAVASIMEEFIK